MNLTDAFSPEATLSAEDLATLEPAEAAFARGELDEALRMVEGLPMTAQLRSSRLRALHLRCAQKRGVQNLQPFLTPLIAAAISDSEACLGLGLAAMDRQCPSEALTWARLAQNIAPNDPRVLLLLGQALHFVGGQDVAIKVLSSINTGGLADVIAATERIGDTLRKSPLL